MAEAVIASPMSRLMVPAGEWRLVQAAGFPLRILSREGALLFRASDIAAAGGVFINNGSTLRGLGPDDAVMVPRAEAGIRKGAPIPFLTLAGAVRIRQIRRVGLGLLGDLGHPATALIGPHPELESQPGTK